MSETTKVILVGGAIVAGWFFFLKPKPIIVGTRVAPPTNPLGSVAGYAPQANFPSNPNDPNNYVPSIITSLAGLGTSIAGAVAAGQKAGGASSSSGAYNGDTSYSQGDTYIDDLSQSDWESAQN